MICGNPKCGKDAGKNKQGIAKRYCSTACAREIFGRIQNREIKKIGDTKKFVNQVITDYENGMPKIVMMAKHHISHVFIQDLIALHNLQRKYVCIPATK